MPFSYRELFLGRTKFCCCIPVRIGVIIMAVLGIVFSAVLSIALWYEVSGEHSIPFLPWRRLMKQSAVNHKMTSGIKAAFVIGGLVETFLFAASIFG